MTYRTLTLATLALVGSLGTAAAQSAPQNSPPPPVRPAAQVPSLVVPNAANSAAGKTLLSTTLLEQNPAVTSSVLIASGYVSLGKSTLTCPAGANCIVEATQFAQLYGNSVSINPFSICWNLDNVRVECPYVGLIPPTQWVMGSNSSWKSPVKPGQHTAEFLIYTGSGGYLGRYSVAYRVYR